ncbi:MBL fold metallo-hydrolase [Goodfellowiella coeruleoviolacea]|uniref:L-ascorbate metabolism protein UlaG, beta-lactamase superfamily n=1 Tax=Goodfellowiella coeruleoviolacea TaxID=334858 RepID=A0AAE3GJY6_9PSEU|nr:MBL fold metallo-hydrolase [Goodfellowiella coeruleoviolacea]MCP2169652.1 L-ascorbate metabolism protein UlaG, beta-lactamase superfamily [Goodfellowiella coeruleoviolacea]
MCTTCGSGPAPDGAGRMNRRRMLFGSAGAAVAVGTGVALGTLPRGTAEAEPRRPDGRRHGVNLRWLGVAGWELSFDGRRVLIDPYLSRFPVWDAHGRTIDDYPIAPRTDLLDRHLTERPELVLVTHGHYDHLAEVPYVLSKFPDQDGATTRVIGTETHAHLLTALGVDPARVVIVDGGEHLDFHGFTVQVVRSSHSRNASYGYYAPGTLTAPPARTPTVIKDLLEGGSLGYLVRIADRYSILFLSGTADFVAGEVAGLRPDALVLGVSGHANVHDYVGRVLRATQPALVIPSHHDDMVTQLDDPALPPKGSPAAAKELTDTIARLGLNATVLDPTILAWETL